MDTYLYREYGWAKTGEKTYGNVSGKKYRRTSIVAAQIENKIISPLQFSGTMDSVLFETWFENCLLKALPKKSVIVMDNASFHRKSRLISLAENKNFRIIFLPPYSPELNPIENFWSWLKRKLRKILRFHSSFDSAILECFKVN